MLEDLIKKDVPDGWTPDAVEELEEEELNEFGYHGSLEPYDVQEDDKLTAESEE